MRAPAASPLLPPADTRVSGWIGVIVVAVFALLLARLFQLQVLRGGAYADRAERARTRPVRITGASLGERPTRGTIFDREGRELAVSHYDHRLTIDYGALKPPPRRKDAPADAPAPEDPPAVAARKRAARAELVAEVPRALAAAGLDFDAARVAEVLGERGLGRGPDDAALAVVVGKVTPRQKRELEAAFAARRAEAPDRATAAVRDLAYGTLGFEDVVARTYPFGELTTQVLGIVGASSDADDPRILGRTGIERQLDLLLGGAGGSLGGEQTGGGVRFKLAAGPAVPRVDGAEVRLTIDVEIQKILFAALRKNAKTYKSLRASAVVLDAATGEILGAASIPTTEPGGERFDPAATRLGVVEDSLEPGSTIKPINFAWAVETGRIRGDDGERFDCGGWDKRETFYGRTVTDYSVNPNPLTATEILYRSSNVGATRVAVERLGIDGLYAGYEAFRLLAKPGSGLANEAGQVIAPKEGDPSRGIRPASLRWEGCSFAQGYGLRVSPLALAAAYTVFATGGDRVEPTIFKEIRRGGSSFKPEPRRTRVVSRASVDAVKRGMRLVVEHPNGTAHKTARSDRYVYCGKTGTSQFDYVRGVTRFYNAWMAAVAPAEDPRIAVVVVHHKVNVGQNSAYTGGSISGPVMREVVDGVLERLGVPPNREAAPPAAETEQR